MCPETWRLLPAEAAERRIAQRSEAAGGMVADAFARHLAPVFSNGVAALAVGGFGRRELFPHSDIDVMLLTRQEISSTKLKEPAGRFMQELWDTGLRLSHSVHTVDECCQVYDHNVELSISLLDQRFLAGDSAVHAELETELPRFYRMHGRSIARQLAKLSGLRRAKFHNSIYHLEPNIKETPGGFRDMQVAQWMSRLLPAYSAPDLKAPWAFLAPIRVFLHEASKRDDNLLSFELQDAMAGQPAEMMRSYYRHARTVAVAADQALLSAEESQPSLIRQLREWRSRLSNSEFTVSRDRVFLRAAGQLSSEPDLVFRLLEFVARHGIDVSPDLERRLASASDEIAKAALTKPLWPLLETVLSQPKSSVAVRLMHRTGLLGALIPEWARIDCLVVRDYYHRYTVDEHTLVAMEVLESIPDKRFADLMQEVDGSALLRAAILLHDTGKGSGREHSSESERIAAALGKRIGMPQHDIDRVRQLVALHLELSSTMNTRDMDDGRTARILADRVGTVEQLKALTLLTFADISAVNPTAMTSWRGDQLWRAYVIGREELTRELETERIHDFHGADTRVARFLEGLPGRYLRTHSGEEFAGHAALAELAEEKGVALDLVRSNGYWRVVVAAPDRPGLFASIAGALSAFGMNILKAEAFANSNGHILDTFTFGDPLRTLELNPSETDRLRDTIARVVLGKQDVRKLIASRRSSAKPRRVEARIGFNNDASQSATLVEIVAEDRPGLVYDLASTMSNAGCDIVVVLIDTEASKALDVFYVTAKGAKLDAARQASLRSALMEACSTGRV